MSVTIVSGVPGVGTSRVCEETRRRHDELILINVGDVMLEQAVERGLTTDREELASLPLRDQLELRRRAGEYVARRADGESLLVSTHFVVKTAAGFIPGFDTTLLDDIDPNQFVVIDAPTATILDRRADSDYRHYGADTGDAIEFQRQLQAGAAMTYAFQTGTPIRYISNTDSVDAASEELAAAVDHV